MVDALLWTQNEWNEKFFAKKKNTQINHKVKTMANVPTISILRIYTLAIARERKNRIVDKIDFFFSANTNIDFVSINDNFVQRVFVSLERTREFIHFLTLCVVWRGFFALRAIYRYEKKWI